EKLFDFPHFTALQVSNFHGHLFQCRTNECQGGNIIGVAVSLQRLRRYRCWAKSQLFANRGFNFRRYVCKGAYRAAHFAKWSIVSCALNTLLITLHLRIPKRAFESKSRWLRMYAVRAPHHYGVFVFFCFLCQHVNNMLNIIAKNFISLL